MLVQPHVFESATNLERKSRQKNKVAPKVKKLRQREKYTMSAVYTHACVALTGLRRAQCEVFKSAQFVVIPNVHIEPVVSISNTLLFL